jgi:hypothetical protein
LVGGGVRGCGRDVGSGLSGDDVDVVDRRRQRTGRISVGVEVTDAPTLLDGRSANLGTERRLG